MVALRPLCVAALLAVMATALLIPLPPAPPAAAAPLTPSTQMLATGREAGLTPAQQLVLALLDEQVPFDFAGLPFVDVSLGVPWGHGDGPMWSVRRHGFVVADDGATFEVVFFAGDRMRAKRSPTGTPGHRRVALRSADLTTVAHDLLATAGRDGSFTHDWRTPMSPRTMALLAARTLARNGDIGGFTRVWSALPPALQDATRLTEHPEESLFAIDLEQRLVLAFADCANSWRDLWQMHGRWLARFPRSRVFDDVKERHDELAIMMDEQRPRSPWRRATTAQMVFDLRDQVRSVYSNRWFGHEHVPVLAPPPPESQWAFAALVRRQLDAVPLLLPVLRDDSLTRSINYYTGKGRNGLHVRWKGEVARDVLQHLAGRRPEQRGGHNEHRIGDWPEWFEAARRQGLREWLDAEMRTAPERMERVGSAATYLELWPDDVEAVLRASEAPSAPAADLLEIALVASRKAAPGGDPRVVARLRDVAAKGELVARTRAASVLLDHGDTAGVEALRRAWLEGLALDDDAWLVLLRAGSPAIWRDVLGRLDDERVRAGLASVVHQWQREDVLGHLQPQGRECDDLARRALQRLLADSSPYRTRHRFRASIEVLVGDRVVTLHRATHADLAAHALAAWWPAEFTFDRARTGTERRWQIEAMRTGGAPRPLATRSGGPDDDMVTSIEFARGADGVDAAKAELRGLVGLAPDVPRIARCLERVAVHFPHGTFELHLERTAAGGGFRARCEHRLDPAEHDALRCERTVAGECDQGSWFGANDDHGPLRSWFDLPRGASIEVTFQLQRK